MQLLEKAEDPIYKSLTHGGKVQKLLAIQPGKCGMSVKYRETDSFSAPVAQDFMTYLLHEGIQFRTINVHR